MAAATTTMVNREFYGCSKADEAYEQLEKLGEGTFGEVHKARHRPSGCVVALKKILLHNEKEGFPVTALREIKILKDLDHSNVIPLVDMSIERVDRKSRCSVFMVTPYMDHDLSGLLQNTSVTLALSHIKCYMKQLLEGINYIHQQGYLHRDIKTANILIDNFGIVKLADFGLARKYLGDKPTKQGAGPAQHAYTALVVTRWYRPPELVLGESRYTSAIDMWGIGCVFGEMFKRNPILQGDSDIDQGHRIFKLVGSPTEESMPGFSQLPGAREFVGSYPRQLESVFGHRLDKYALSLLSGLLDLNPLKRLTALGALEHPLFQADPLPAQPHELPRYSASHEMTTRKRKENVPHAPNVNPSQHPQNQPPGSQQYQQFASAGYIPRNNGHHHHHHGHHRNNNHHNNRHYNNRRRGGGGHRGGGGGGGLPPYRQQQPHPTAPYRKGPPSEPPYRSGGGGRGPPQPPPTRPPYDYDRQDNRPPYRRRQNEGLNYDEDANIVKRRRQ